MNKLIHTKTREIRPTEDSSIRDALRFHIRDGSNCEAKLIECSSYEGQLTGHSSWHLLRNCTINRVYQWSERKSLFFLRELQLINFTTRYLIVTNLPPDEISPEQLDHFVIYFKYFCNNKSSLLHASQCFLLTQFRTVYIRDPFDFFCCYLKRKFVKTQKIITCS